MSDTGLISIACGLIIGFGAIGACLGIGVMGGRFICSCSPTPSRSSGLLFLHRGLEGPGAIIVATGGDFEHDAQGTSG